jgi:hypothetical protein
MNVSCWNCKSASLVVIPDSFMNGLTDVCVCLDCAEAQDDETMEAVVIRTGIAVRAREREAAAKQR